MTDESLFLDIDMLDNQFAAELALKDSIIAELDQEIAEKDAEIAALKEELELHIKSASESVRNKFYMEHSK